MAEPFVDIKLENIVLRHLIVDDDDDKGRVEEINKNIGYVSNLGLDKQIFFSDFKQWIFDIIIKNYVLHSECISKNIVLKRARKQYQEKEEFEKKQILIDKIFELSLTKTDFKPLLDDLRQQYNYRLLFNMNVNLHTKLKDDHENKKADSLSIVRDLSEKTTKILSSYDRFRIIEEDLFQNFDADITEIENRRKNPDKYKGIPTGFKKIDDATGGWLPGELTIVLGRPSMGKSVLLLNFGKFAYDMRFNVIYVTIEMPIEQQKRRLFSNIGKIEYKKLKRPELLTDEEFEKIKLLREKFQNKFGNRFWIIDAPEKCTPSFLESRILRFESLASKKAELVLVDPIYLMKPTDSKTEDPIGTISWELKILARKLNVSIIAASQFNRESHKRHLHGKDVDTVDAAFTDKISNNCDNMIGITGDKKKAELSFPKTRDSMITKVFLDKDFDHMRFLYDPKKNQERKDDDEDDDDEREKKPAKTTKEKSAWDEEGEEE